MGFFANVFHHTKLVIKILPFKTNIYLKVTSYYSQSPKVL